MRYLNAAHVQAPHRYTRDCLCDRPQALLWRQWLVKSRTPITTLVEVLSPILLMSIVVYAYSLVEPELRPERIYANRTAELVYNISRDASRSQLASDMRLCAALLQPPPVAGGPRQQPPSQQGDGAGTPAQPAASTPQDGSVVPPGRRRLRQNAQQQPGGVGPTPVPDPQPDNGAQDPTYREWAAMRGGMAGTIEAASAEGSASAFAAGTAEPPSAGVNGLDGVGGVDSAGTGGADLPSAAVTDGVVTVSALYSTPGSASEAGEQDPAYQKWLAMRNGAAAGAGAKQPAAPSVGPAGGGVAGSAAEPPAGASAPGPAQQALPDPSGIAVRDAPASAVSEAPRMRDPTYAEWSAMRSGAAAGDVAGPATGTAPTARVADSSGSAPAPAAGKDAQESAYLAWLAMHGEAARNGPGPGPTAAAPVDAPAAAPAADSVGTAPAPQPQEEGTGLQDPGYLAWLAMTGRAAVNDASSPDIVSAAGPGSPSAAQAISVGVPSALQGAPSQSTSMIEGPSPAADVPGVAGPQDSSGPAPAQDRSASVPAPGISAPAFAQGVPPATVPAHGSSVAGSGGGDVDWTQVLTPSVLAAALQLSQNPFDPATWQKLLQSGAPLMLHLALLHHSTGRQRQSQRMTRT